MRVNIEYDEKLNRAYGEKIVVGETNYYLGLAKVCPRCNKYITGYSALSREDNKTEICSNCGTLEALESFKSYQNERIIEYIGNFDISNKQKRKLINKHYYNNECGRLEVYGIIYEFLQKDVLRNFKIDISKDDTFGEQVNNVINDLVLKYVF